MWRLLFFVVLAGLGASGAAVGQPAAEPATVAALNSAASAPRTPGRAREYSVEQKLSFGRARAFSLYAGASGDARELQEDPRWRASHETRSANALVNTRFGVGWEDDTTRVSFGYLRRQL